MPDRLGRPPTADELQLMKAAESLGPDKVLTALEATAKLVLASVVLVASVLTGFGLFADVASRLREEPMLLARPVAAATISALLAIAALIPWPWRVDVDNLDSLRSRFKWQVIVRGALVIAAMLLLLAAVFMASVGVARYVTIAGPTSPSIAFSHGVGEDGATVAATVKLSRAPTGSIADVVIHAEGSDDPVFRASQVVGTSGEVEITATVAKPLSDDLVLDFTLSDGETPLVETTATLP